MKKFLAAAGAFAVLAMPAFADSMTIEFAGDDGTTATYVFDDATSMATLPDGTIAPYTWDEATATLCGETPEGPVCATFTVSDEEPKVGDVSAYTLSTGGGGMATIIAMAAAEPTGS